ncbi:hypothetical protein B0H16DRAFT_1559438 [Mycena metata]|uniref:Uncharacterized protein n=1 Tax=Mycena metata TaxID=1033252 RepID=A0AAD7ILF9_9AGAR|nr:hypothetical protein B0H16DRAFT_1559438 [Mycena metata]
MSSAGLSRRRAPTSSASTQPNDDDGPNPSSPPSPSPAPTSTNTGDAAATAPAMQARRLEAARASPTTRATSSWSSEVGGAVPRLTLMEEVLLLGIKDQQGYLSS